MNLEWLNHLLEFFSQLGNLLNNIWTWFVGIAPTIDGICLSFITYYTFRLTVFPKKLKFINFRLSGSAFDGDALEITLENRSLCPAVVESVDLIIGSKKIQFFRGECIIDGFKTGKIEMPRYSQIVSTDGPIDIDICAMDKISLLVKTTRGIQHIRYETISKMAYRRIQKLEEKFDSTTVCRNHYGDRIVVPGVRYAISYVDHHGEKQTVFIHKSGTMSAAPFGYNGLPKDIILDEAAIRKHFDAEFEKCNLSYHLAVFHDPFTEEAEGDQLCRHEDDDSTPVKGKIFSGNSIVLVVAFASSLSLTWDIVKAINPDSSMRSFFPLFQFLCFAAYTWLSIIATNDIQIFNDFLDKKPRRKQWVSKLAHICAKVIFGLPSFFMWLTDAIFSRDRLHEKTYYREDFKKKIEIFDSKPLIVRTFAIPSAIMLIINILIAVKVLPEGWIPIVHNVLDAFVSFIGLALVLVNAKQKQNSSKENC